MPCGRAGKSSGDRLSAFYIERGMPAAAAQVCRQAIEYCKRNARRSSSDTAAVVPSGLWTFPMDTVGSFALLSHPRPNAILLN
ncbi:MAG: hypothetical protein LBT53_08410 [Puniceicoccales bacterium]|nr:hypothetical protein [Puniceicoccales bacterium]